MPPVQPHLLASSMPADSLFTEIAILFGAALIVALICFRLRIPYIIGYLITGLLVGPYSLDLIHSRENVNLFAEIGVILLMFTVGLEFSFGKLRQIQRYVLLGGSLQALFVIIICFFIIVVLNDRGLSEGVFWGFLWVPSSTAIVVKLLQDRLELASPPGRITLAILLFQDLIVIPMLLLTPILAGLSADPGWEILLMLLRLMALALISVLLARFVIPRLLKEVMRLQSTDVFLIGVLAIALGVTLLSAWLGLSPALGAFIAGLIIAETDYNRLAITCVLPFRYVFISFFFISIGMLLNFHELPYTWPRLLYWLPMLMVTKLVAGFLAVKLLPTEPRRALTVGLYLTQIGEFSFVLALGGVKSGIISEADYQVFLAGSIFTMGLTPIFIMHGPRLAERIFRK